MKKKLSNVCNQHSTYYPCLQINRTFDSHDDHSAKKISNKIFQSLLVIFIKIHTQKKNQQNKVFLHDNKQQ